jgi:hypothetical protein
LSKNGEGVRRKKVEIEQEGEKELVDTSSSICTTNTWSAMWYRTQIEQRTEPHVVKDQMG